MAHGSAVCQSHWGELLHPGGDGRSHGCGRTTVSNEPAYVAGFVQQGCVGLRAGVPALGQGRGDFADVRRGFVGDDPLGVEDEPHAVGVGEFAQVDEQVVFGLEDTRDSGHRWALDRGVGWAPTAKVSTATPLPTGLSSLYRAKGSNRKAV